MNVSGENAKLWINERTRADGSTWNDYSIGVSKKKEDGTYTSKYMKVRFAKSVNVPQGLPNGVSVDYNGFLTVDEYTDRDGNEVKNLMAMITEASFDYSEPREERYTDEEVSRFGSIDDVDVPF